MTDGKNETALTVRTDNTALRNKTAKVSAIQRAEVGAADYVPHVSAGQVKLMAVNGSPQCSPRSSPRYSFVVVNCWQAIYTCDSSANKTDFAYGNR